ncbi:hypothetical protein FHX74_002099 [Friedmanniella endophytica]|uniref:Uncharacterized protein n=1 Tax=Microlunatus kandeliicorticis TaxID=1759536 RepID=A0A7W3ISL7_9ACTN|nr:hypothetical protein [Microlunatus kandeliicorticis]MBA8794480.1 hypothetical protein [Microlunatus kandeliicorticis]
MVRTGQGLIRVSRLQNLSTGTAVVGGVNTPVARLVTAALALLVVGVMVVVAVVALSGS